MSGSPESSGNKEGKKAKSPIENSENNEQEVQQVEPLGVHVEVGGSLKEFGEMEPTEEYDRYTGGPYTTYRIWVKIREFESNPSLFGPSPFILDFESKDDYEKALRRLAGCKGKNVRIVRYQRYWYGIFCGPTQQEQKSAYSLSYGGEGKSDNLRRERKEPFITIDDLVDPSKK